MIANFSVANYRSISEEQTISFLTTPDKHNRDLIAVEVAKGVFINKLAIFFGANASGKSNILQGIEALFMLMCSPAKEKTSPITEYCPFKLENSNPTRMKVDFYAEGKHYWYEITFDREKILEENLYYTPKRNRSLFYSRKYTGADSQPEIDFGTTLGFSLKTKESLRESTFNNHSVLSTVAKLSLKDDAIALTALHNWVMNHVHNINGDYPNRLFVTKLNKINSDQRKKEFYLRLLSKADFNITDFRLVDKRGRYSKELVEDILNDRTVSEDRRIAMLNDVVFTNHSKFGDFEIPLEYQSKGTTRFIELLEILYDLVSDNHIYFLDELGNQMHYDLIVFYILLYLYNSEESQMLFTSQSILLLDEDFVRRDIVYLSEKDPETASTTYERVSDMGLHKNLSLYNAYRIGKLGSRPELGSPYLNLKKK